MIKKLGLAVALLAVLLIVGCGGAAHTTRQAPRPAGFRAPTEGHKPVFKLVPFAAAHQGVRATAAIAVPAAPDGPGGSWSVAYADAFGAPLGSGPGLDGTLAAHSHDNGCCSNSNEIMAERPSKVVEENGLLKLLCTKESVVSGKPYTCGGVSTSSFKWRPGGGQSFAFEVVAQFPPRDEGEDPGWWSTDAGWTDEADFFEGWEWNHTEYYAGLPVWKAQIGGCGVSHEAYKLASEIPNPETGFHTYTTVFNSDNTEAEYIDGVKRWTLPAPCGVNKPMMSLILTHALRQSSSLAGTNSFSIKRIAVYEDSAHAGQNIEGGGLAPGTTVGGTPPPPPPVTTETTPPPPPPPPVTTETTPPPPPPPPVETPATPSGLKATPGTGAVTVSWNADAGASSYQLYRTGPWPSWVPVGQPWTTVTATSAVNKAEVTPGRPYCFWLRAVNSKGASAKAGPVCATP
ncbi:MAG TPA: fibronectin type III domain-containing protein [Solirubrobacteraceae bacterium]|jgi:hypothetical protein